MIELIKSNKIKFGNGYVNFRTASSFASKNKEIFEAIKIASGGVSGGISSWIAGGKFNNGFKQGLITSGLNHAAHAFSKKFGRIIKTRKEIRDVGLDPDMKAPNTCESIDILLKTETLSVMNNEAGGPGFIFEELPLDKGAVTVGAIKSKVVDYIKINSRVNRTFYTLYGHIVHELLHAIDFVSGNRLGIYNLFIKKGYNDRDARDFSKYWSEMRAYNFNMNHTPTNFYLNKYNFNKNKHNTFQIENLLLQ